MSFVDFPLNAGEAGLTVSGLALSQTAAMTLQVASGSATTHQDGVTHTLAAAESQTFAADATNPTEVFMALIDNGVNVDLWVDAYVDDGLTQQADVPAGYELILAFAWFSIPANETDLANVTINRRTWV